MSQRLTLMILMTDTNVSERSAAFDIQRTGVTNIDFFYPEDSSNFLSETVLLFYQDTRSHSKNSNLQVNFARQYLHVQP